MDKYRDTPTMDTSSKFTTFRSQSLSSNGLIPKRSTDYHATVSMCLTSGFAVLPLHCVLKLSLVFGIRARLKQPHWMPKYRCNVRKARASTV